MNTPATDLRERDLILGVAGAAVFIPLAFGRMAWDEAGIVYALHVTARVSLAFFLLAYIASPVRRIFAGRFAQWLVANRRYFGISAAFAHTVHFGFVLAHNTAVAPSSAVVIVFGGLGMLLYWAMLVTSNDRAQRALGPRWRQLHSFGLHYLWTLYLVLFAAGVPEQSWYMVVVALLLVALGLRLYARQKSAVAA